MSLKPINFKQRLLADGIDAEKAVVVAKKIKTRWPKMEPLILKNPETAYKYALFVIGDRWPEAEPVILQNNIFANVYAYYVIGDRWPELEQKYKKTPNSVYYKDYIDYMKHLKKELT